MSLYAIADLHLSGKTPKPMDIFGSRWQDHAAKIAKNWRAIVDPEDTVILPGDISWALSLEDAMVDFRWIDELPGRKLIGKGNHDFWWATVSKMKKTFADEKISTIDFLYNNAFETEDYIVCGTRGWYMDERQQNTVNETDFEKIVARENQRLALALDSAVPLREATGKPILVFFHFPPVFKDFVCKPLLDTMHRYGVDRCYYGHIHGIYSIPPSEGYDGIRCTIISADYLNFVPRIIPPPDET